MQVVSYLGVAAIAAAVLGGSASAANMCQAGKLACATTMPVGGFCECTSHGSTEEGTVVKKLPPHSKVNSTAGGCGAHPGAPGCK